MAKMSAVDLHTETAAAAEGGLKELVLRWFNETQAPLVLNDGSFPDWFRGFAARKDTEDLLRDKTLGCFLIRLSDKAIGYILSYKGHDRCRHFVITQNQEGRFVITGDCQTYGGLAELIEHYKVSPIQPFGEYLTSSCYEVNAGELYDVVNAKGKSGVSVQALRTLWDQKHDRHGDPTNNRGIQQQNEAPTVQPPALPLKSKSRKLTGTVSVDTMSLSQGVPPVPKRGLPLGCSLSGSLPDTESHPSEETQTDPNRSERLRGNTTSDGDSFNTTDTSCPGDLCPPGVMYSELTHVESRSKPQPSLNNSNTEEEEEEEYSNQLSHPSLSTSSSYSATPVKKVTCHTYSLHEPRDGSRSRGSWSDHQGGVVESVSRSNPLYQSLRGPRGGSAQQGDGMYAEVPPRPTPAGLPDDTYEPIPAAVTQGNTYESLENVKTEKSKSTWGKSNVKWRKFLPDYMKK